MQVILEKGRGWKWWKTKITFLVSLVNSVKYKILLEVIHQMIEITLCNYLGGHVMVIWPCEYGLEIWSPFPRLSIYLIKMGNRISDVKHSQHFGAVVDSQPKPLISKVEAWIWVRQIDIFKPNTMCFIHQIDVSTAKWLTNLKIQENGRPLKLTAWY